MKHSLSLVVLAGFAVGFSSLWAGEIRFSEMPEPSPLRFAQEQMTMEKTPDGLAVEAPNFWSCGWQMANISWPLDAVEGKPLILRACGSAPIGEFRLVLRLRSADWQRADVYEIPLPQLEAAQMVDFESTSPLGEPVEKEEGGLNPGESPAHLQFVFKGQGNAPVSMVLESITLGRD